MNSDHQPAKTAAAHPAASESDAAIDFDLIRRIALRAPSLSDMSVPRPMTLWMALDVLPQQPAVQRPITVASALTRVAKIDLLCARMINDSQLPKQMHAALSLRKASAGGIEPITRAARQPKAVPEHGASGAPGSPPRSGATHV